MIEESIVSQAPESFDPRTPGLSPDELVHVGERLTDVFEIRVFRYDASTLETKTGQSIDDCLAFADQGPTAWVQVVGLHEVKLIAQLAAALDIHPLVREDILNTLHRPKLETHQDFIFAASKLLKWDEKTDSFSSEQLSLILKDRLVISFHESEPSQFMPVIERLHRDKERLRMLGADYMFWALLDTTLDHHFPVLDGFDKKLATLEEQLESEGHPIDSAEIFAVRRAVMELYGTIRPLREVVAKIQRLDSPLITDQTTAFYRDLADNAWHAIDAIEALRETSVSLRDFHTAALNNRMNEVMKVLTCFAAIFMPLTFIAGIYGMNFRQMPELDWRWGYLLVWGTFIVVAAAMFLFFRRRRWL